MLTHRASGVVNFAHAALGMYVAFAFFELRQTSELVLPVLGLPARVTLVERPTVLSALVTCIVLAAVVGFVVYWIVFRPLRSAPALARVVASLGLLLYFQETVRLRFPRTSATELRIEDLLPGGSLAVAGVRVPWNRFVLAGLAIAIAIALWMVFRATRFGLATRGAAEHEKGALLLGLSPDRLAAVNWTVASVLSGVSVILIASVTKQLDPLVTSLLVVPALAAALLGGLSSFTVTTAAGLAIGMAQSATLNFVVRADWLPEWLPRGGVQQALPFLVILLAITLRGDSLPTRGTVLEQRLPVSPRPRHPWLVALVLGSAALVGLLTLDSQWRLAIVVSMIAVLIGLSSVVLTGYVGQISLAQFAFAGVAGFSTAKLADDAGIPFPWSPLLAVVLTVLVGVAVGVPAVRVRGMTLAVATLGAAVAIQELVFKSATFGGIAGKSAPRPSLFGVDLGFFATGRDNFRPAFGILVLLVVIVAGIAVANLRRSPTGLRWLAVRANERAAAAVGIDVTATKLSAFAVSSVLAGAGGALLAYQYRTLSPDAFTVFASLALLALVYLGGIASVGGALVAGLLAAGGIMTRLSGGTSGEGSEYQFAISGIALIVVAIFYPDGITGAIRSGLGRVRRVRS